MIISSRSVRALGAFKNDDTGSSLVRGVQMLLKSKKSIADQRHTAELRRGVVDGVIFQLEQRAELLLIEFADALLDVLAKHEIKKRLQFSIVPRENASSASLDPFRACDRRKRVFIFSECQPSRASRTMASSSAGKDLIIKLFHAA
jgi:hypothetical protein